MSNEPELTAEQVEERLEQKTAPRVTKDLIQGKIAQVEYVQHGNVTTICFITMRNGFVFDGISACASPENYDPKIGEHYAYENAFRKIWSHEGYLLKETLSK